MSDIDGLVGGLAQGLNAYLGRQQQVQGQMAIQNNASQNQLGNAETLELYKQTLAGKISPDTASQINPNAAKMVSDFQSSNGRLPSVDEFNNLLSNINGGVDQQQKQQDSLEKQAMDRLTTVRGDQSLMRAEHQRDAAGMAYDTIQKAMSENRDLTQMEQSDLMGQLWQARTGKAPTDQDMKQIQDTTAKRGFNHAVTWLTGDPSVIGASTPETLANLRQFVDATGQKADQQWNGYMSPRLNKPTGLEDSRWQHILQTTRGISYADQKSTSDKTYPITPSNASQSGEGQIYTYPSGRKAMFTKGKWEPYNG